MLNRLLVLLGCLTFSVSSTLAEIHYEESWDEGSLAGWGVVHGLSEVRVESEGGNPDGYLFSSAPTGAAAGGKTDLPEATGDYGSAGVESITLDLNLISGDVSGVMVRARYLDAVHNGWHYYIPHSPNSGQWVSYVVQFDPLWSDEDAIGAGWEQEVSTPSFAETMANVYTVGVRVSGFGPLEVGLDNFAIHRAPTPTASVSWAAVKDRHR